MIQIICEKEETNSSNASCAGGAFFLFPALLSTRPQILDLLNFVATSLLPIILGAEVLFLCT
jgi:hypothetical protein